MNEVYKLTNTRNDCWKSQFGKENPIFTKKKVIFSLLKFHFRAGPRAWPFLRLGWAQTLHPPPSPSWQKSHLLAPYRCMKFEREKKLSFFCQRNSLSLSNQLFFMLDSVFFSRWNYFFSRWNYFFSLGVSPHPPPSPSWQKSHLLAHYRCVKFKREKKLYFFLLKK
jgi:hypothetical protein